MKRGFLTALLAVVLLTACNSKYNGLKDGLYADIQTEKGDIVVELFTEEVPMTVANFIALAEGDHPQVVDSMKGKNYYDGLGFHRVIKDFMIQGGDITGTGAGYPGYQFQDEFPRDSLKQLILKHDAAGVLSMANSGNDTNGSQFFITHKPTPWLDGIHTVFGRVLSGQQVVDSIAQYDMIKTVKIIRKGESAKAFNAPEVFKAQQLHIKELNRLALEKESAKKLEFLKKMEASKAKKQNSGLGILSLSNKGKGKKVGETTDVKAHYTLYLANGEMIQSTVGSDPFEFNFSKRPMIAGFKEGVLGLRKGDKVRLFIPYYLAYGERAYGPFPAKSDIIFEVEILNVK